MVKGFFLSLLFKGVGGLIRVGPLSQEEEDVEDFPLLGFGRREGGREREKQGERTTPTDENRHLRGRRQWRPYKGGEERGERKGK